MATQPDFAVISHNLQSLSVEFGRCANLPAIDQGAHVLQALGELRDLVLSTREEVGRLGQQLDRIEVGLRTL